VFDYLSAKKEGKYGPESEVLQGKLDHLSKDERELIGHVLLEYSHVFNDEESNNFKNTDVIEHQLFVGGT
jgi:hypothetical protein